MKKITTLVAVACVSSLAFAQSQRLVLHEEFTQASCGPCAAANPYYNALVNTNANKVASIKFQTSWPGVDPMNAQNSTEINSRTSTYYAVTGVPDGKQDGVDFYPGNITQSTIDAEYNTPSPFSITCSHTFNTAMDSAFITAVVTCTQNVTMTTGKFYMAMVERQISFSTPPGTNGEKDFYNVVRKMYPNQNGTAIAGTWTNSQNQTFNFSVKIPTYIYSKGEIGFVCWVQDDANKNVKQAGRSMPIALPNDAGVTMVTGITPASCSLTFTPTVTIKNFGTATLTSCTINYKIDNNTTQTLPWVGSLAQNATANVVLPMQTTTAGSHSFTAWTTMPNASTDYETLNDQNISSFLVMNSVATAYPVMEPFTSTTYPPTNWIRSNVNGDAYQWVRVGNVGAYAQAPLGCSKLDWYNQAPGNVDELFMPTTDMSTATGNATLTFDIAYAPYSTTAYIDTLRVLVSTNCGQTWTQVYYKTTNSGMPTAPATTSAFTPTSTQWRNETINMVPYIGQSAVIVRFKASSGNGNNLYIDNVNLSSSAGVDNLSAGVSMNIYPNPVNNNATVNISLVDNQNVSVNVYNMIGENIQTINAGSLSAGSHNISIDASKLPAGVYFVKVTAGAYSVSRKVVVEK